MSDKNMSLNVHLLALVLFNRYIYLCVYYNIIIIDRIVYIPFNLINVIAVTISLSVLLSVFGVSYLYKMRNAVCAALLNKPTSPKFQFTRLTTLYVHFHEKRCLDYDNTLVISSKALCLADGIGQC